MSYRRGYYKKDGTYVQGHYVGSKSKSTKKNKERGCLRLFLICLLFIITISCREEEGTGCEAKKCSDFSTQAEAQAVFNSAPDCYDNLDTDHDNIPCENLPN